MSRYFADLYDADGFYYVFDGDNGGEGVAGPFATFDLAQAEADERNAREPQ